MDIPREYFQNRTAHRLLIPDETDGILSCGFLVKSAAGHRETDLQFSHYGAFLLLSGSGEYSDGSGRRFHLRQGSCVQRLPGVRHTVMIDDTEEWLEFFVCFGERTCRTLLALGLLSDTPVLYPGISSDLLRKCLSLLRHFEAAQSTDTPSLYFLVQNFAAELFLLDKRGKMSRNSQRSMELASRYLCDIRHIRTPAEAARMAGIPYESFRKKFKSYSGSSPAAFQMQFRINHAKKCLLETDEKIHTIGEICGFADAFCFSKAFKKQCGISPQEYRKLYAFANTGLPPD